LALAISFGLFFSCTKDNVEESIVNNPAPSNLTCAERAVTFAVNIQPYITQTCATPGCHNQSTAGGVRLDSYALIASEAKKSRFINVLKHNLGFSPMPKGKPKASADQIAEIECWIADNTPNN